jgi:hypothetical protein
VFFEYTPKETSAVVGEMFRGFSGYAQADAKSVYDALFQPPEQRPPPDDDAKLDLAERHEVGCWSHARRKFWEAAITKDPIAREGLARIGRIFELDRSWRKQPPDEIKSLRTLHLRAHTDAFFAWVAAEYERVRDQRGLLRTALGYAHAHRQRAPHEGKHFVVLRDELATVSRGSTAGAGSSTAVTEVKPTDPWG